MARKRVFNSNLYSSLKDTVEKIEQDNKRYLETILSSVELGMNTIVVNGKKYTNMSSNDYLGLRHNRQVIDTAIEYAQKYGASSSASRLVTGTLDIHTALEQNLAVFKGTEKALIFNTGFQANSAILSCLTQKQNIGRVPAVFTDKLNHASMHDGLIGIRQSRYKHLDIKHFESIVLKSDNTHKLAVTETVFSMDGDTLDVAKWVDVCKQNEVLSFVDEAYSGGVFGMHGSGLAKGVGAFYSSADARKM